MSKSQKREAERIIEILIEVGFLKRNPNVGMGDRFGVGRHLDPQRETWINELTQAIGIYQAEELGKLMIKRQVQDRKAKE